MNARLIQSTVPPCEGAQLPARPRVSANRNTTRRLNPNRPVIRVQVHKPPSTSLPSPDISPNNSFSCRASPRLPPLTAPPTTTSYFLTPPRPRSHACPYPTPSTPSPLRHRHLPLPHLPSHSSLASSSTGSYVPSTPSRRRHTPAPNQGHTRSPSLTLIFPTPVRPTLAMSLSPTTLHHTPSKTHSNASPTRRPSHSPSQSLGGTIAVAADLEFLRPPSRSERLLRETLRRDSQHQQSGRALSMSPRSRMRRAESYSHPPPYGDMFDCCINDDDDDDDVEEGEGGPLLFAAQKRVPLRRASKSVTEASTTRRGRSPAAAEKLGESSTDSSAFPSPTRSASALPPALERASITKSRPRHHTHPSTQYSLPPPASPRSTLARLLSPRVPASPMHHDRPLPYQAAQYAQDHLQYTQSKTHPHQDRPTHIPKLSSSSSSSSESSTPGTPPPAAAFDAHLASAKLRHTDGYVSFAAVEGLGVPPGEGEESAEEGERRSWLWRWKSG